MVVVNRDIDVRFRRVPCGVQIPFLCEFSKVFNCANTNPPDRAVRVNKYPQPGNRICATSDAKLFDDLRINKIGKSRDGIRYRKLRWQPQVLVLALIVFITVNRLKLVCFPLDKELLLFKLTGLLRFAFHMLDKFHHTIVFVLITHN